jgi:hypothetical protein
VLGTTAKRCAGPRRRRAALALALLVVVSGEGCLYSFRAGSFPSHIRTIAIVPFENETTRLEITQELYDALLREVPRSLGIRPAGEEVADAILRGTITGYDIATPSYRPTADGERAEVLQRQVTISVSVELVDLINNEILWENRALMGQGEFLELSETEDIGRAIAIRLLRQRITDGAQSNW